jgi:hypothetical protein
MIRCECVTAQGEQCRLMVLPGTDACVSHTPGLVGRKTRLDEAVQARLVQLLSAGDCVTAALAAVGLQRWMFYEWLEYAREGREPFVAFRDAVVRARAEGEAQRVVRIGRAARVDWRAAAWSLEQQYPERWGRARIAAGRREPFFAGEVAW